MFDKILKTKMKLNEKGRFRLFSDLDDLPRFCLGSKMKRFGCKWSSFTGEALDLQHVQTTQVVPCWKNVALLMYSNTLCLFCWLYFDDRMLLHQLKLVNLQLFIPPPPPLTPKKGDLRPCKSKSSLSLNFRCVLSGNRLFQKLQGVLQPTLFVDFGFGFRDI